MILSVIDRIYQFLLDKQSDQQQKISESTIFEQPNQRQQIQNLRSQVTSIDDDTKLKKNVDLILIALRINLFFASNPETTKYEVKIRGF